MLPNRGTHTHKHTLTYTHRYTLISYGKLTLFDIIWLWSLWEPSPLPFPPETVQNAVFCHLNLF